MALLIAAAVLLIMAGIIIYNAAVSQEWHHDHRGEENISESEHLYGRVFYANGDDERIVVSKPSGGGYTLNMGNPLSYLVILLFLGGMSVLILWH